MTDVLGFISPCDVCGRKALTTQPLDNYICPACAQLGGFGDVDIAQAEPLDVDDEYPIAKVWG